MEQLAVLILMVGGFILVIKFLARYEKAQRGKDFNWELDHAPNKHPDFLREQKLTNGRMLPHPAHIGGRWDYNKKTWVFKGEKYEKWQRMKKRYLSGEEITEEEQKFVNGVWDDCIRREILSK